MSRRRLVSSLVLVFLLGVAGRSLAQATCAAPSIWAPALTAFCPDNPALAADVNQNFSALVNYVQQKVGTLGSAAVTVTGAAAIQGGLTVTGLTTVNGILRARTLRTEVYSTVPTAAVTYTSASFAATDLTLSFDVPTGGATVELSYVLSGDTTGSCFLATRVMLSGTEVPEARAISGQVQYPQASGRMLRVLPAGSYTASVEYRTNGTIISNPATINFAQRSLVVHVFGNN